MKNHKYHYLTRDKLGHLYCTAKGCGFVKDV